MKVLNTRRIYKRLMEYIEAEELNHLIIMGISTPIANDGIVFEDVGELTDFAEDLYNAVNSEGEFLSMDKALLSSMLMSIATEYFEMEGESEEFVINIVELLSLIGKIYHKDDFSDNPYLSSIQPGIPCSGEYRFDISKYDAYEVFHCDESVAFYEGLMLPRIGAFDHQVSFPVLLDEEDIIIKSVDPFDINTTQEGIDRAEGNVLALGCGLGYFAYMAAIKDNVSHITVVEENGDIINLFEKYILPQFEMKDKITVIQSDPYEFLAKLDDGKYDYCYSEFSADENVGTYIRLKSICSKFSKMKVAYKQESSALAAVRFYILMQMITGYSASDIRGLSTFLSEDLFDTESEDYLVVKDMLKDVVINNRDQIDYYLDTENIKHLLDGAVVSPTSTQEEEKEGEKS